MTDDLSAIPSGEARIALNGDDTGMVAAHGTFTKGLTYDEFGRLFLPVSRSFFADSTATLALVDVYPN